VQGEPGGVAKLEGSLTDDPEGSVRSGFLTGSGNEGEELPVPAGRTDRRATGAFLDDMSGSP
jgi:hypothetical protein